MLTQRHRPFRFEEMFGQDLVKKVLTAVSRDPTSAPRSIILQGEFGTGKTTSARILARTLNCKHDHKSKRPCGECQSCLADLDLSPTYQEFDCAVVGSVDSIRRLREDFFAVIPEGMYRVVVFDEFHLASRQAQSALLKSLEDSLSPRLFVLFCTTNVDQILATIRSRSIELTFEKVDIADVVTCVQQIARKENISLSEEQAVTLGKASRGHMRNAVMNLHMLSMVGDTEEFLQGLRSSEIDIINLLIAIREADKVSFKQALHSLCTQPLATVKQDFSEVLLSGMRHFAGEGESIYQDKYEQLVELYQQELFKLLSFSMNTWALNSFSSDSAFQAMAWSLWASFQKKASTGPSLMDRARVRR